MFVVLLIIFVFWNYFVAKTDKHVLKTKENEPKKKIDTPNTIKESSLINFFMRKYDYKYPMKFFGHKKPSKELYETLAAHYVVYTAIRRIFSSSGEGNVFINLDAATVFENDENVLCIVAGDGTCPRTAYGFAKQTKWKVISIDPLMGNNVMRGTNTQTNNANELIERKYGCELPSNLTCVRSKAECFQYGSEFSYVILVHVHSHANFQEMWDKFEGYNRIGYTMLCCGHVVHKLNNDTNLMYSGRYGVNVEKSDYYVYHKNNCMLTK